MAIYVDKAHRSYGGKKWARLTGDSAVELHALAKKIGIYRVWCQEMDGFLFYPITEYFRKKAIQNGALQVTSKAQGEKARQNRLTKEELLQNKSDLEFLLLRYELKLVRRVVAAYELKLSRETVVGAEEKLSRWFVNGRGRRGVSET